jgi:Protein of unknown function (DUF455)
MPLCLQEFYTDFARVADDEGRHFGWCLQRLNELGYTYGDLPVHDLLWEGCRASAADLSARLAVVPMSQVRCQLIAGAGQQSCSISGSQVARVGQHLHDWSGARRILPCLALPLKSDVLSCWSRQELPTAGGQGAGCWAAAS